MIYGLREKKFSQLPIQKQMELSKTIIQKEKERDKKTEALVNYIMEECRKKDFSLSDFDTLLRKLEQELASARFYIEDSPL